MVIPFKNVLSKLGSKSNDGRKNIVLVDYENVQPNNLNLLNKNGFEVIIFVGALQQRIDTKLAIAIQKLRGKAKYVQISGSGKNALDFHIPFYIGRISEKDKLARFYIISKDTGFDPLITHLKQNKILCSRLPDINKIPSLKATSKIISKPKTVSPKPPADKTNTVISDLIKMGKSKPKSLETLSNRINGLFNKQLTPEQLNELITALKNKKIIQVNHSKVSYTLPSAKEFKANLK